MTADGKDRRLVDTGPTEGLVAQPNVDRRGGVAHIPPQWAPDGARLAFVGIDGDVSSEGDGTYAIYTVGADGKDRQRLTDTVSVPAWAPDGSRLAFARASQTGIGIYTIRPDGTDVRILTHIARWDPTCSDCHLPRIWVPVMAWSPDGEHLLYSWDDKIHVISLDGSARRWSLPGHEGQPTAAWSPDGSRIAVVLTYGDSAEVPGPAATRVALHTMAADGGDRRILVHETADGTLEATGAANDATQ